MYALLLLIWLVSSLATMGVLCFCLAILFAVWPTDVVHQMMWWLYVKWVAMLGWFVRHMVKDIQLHGSKDLPQDKPYILIANHYSWMDIIVLYATIFSKHRSFVFVMKRSLIYIPFIGVVCWGLGHPLVERGRSRLATEKVLTEAAEKAKKYNYGMMIFPEGSRYTKNPDGHPDYKHLLKPKRMGFEMIAKVFGETACVVDITLNYKDKEHSVSDFLLGRIHKVDITCETHDVQSDDARHWIMRQWAKKDLFLQQEQHPQSEES